MWTVMWTHEDFFVKRKSVHLFPVPFPKIPSIVPLGSELDVDKLDLERQLFFPRCFTKQVICSSEASQLCWPQLCSAIQRIDAPHQPDPS